MSKFKLFLISNFKKLRDWILSVVEKVKKWYFEIKLFLISNFKKLRDRILSVVEKVKKWYFEILSWIKNTIKKFKNFVKLNFNKVLRWVLSQIQFCSVLLVGIISIIIFCLDTQFWVDECGKYLIDVSLLQNIILAILAFFVPFVVAAYSNIFSITQEKNETITEEKKIKDEEEKIKDFDKLVLVNTVLQPNATFILTICLVTFLSLIPFLVNKFGKFGNFIFGNFVYSLIPFFVDKFGNDKFGNFVYSLIPIILLFCVFNFWNTFQNLLRYSTDGAFLYQLEFLKSLQFTKDHQKNEKIADKMVRAWRGVWVKKYFFDEEKKLIDIFIEHLKLIIEQKPDWTPKEKIYLIYLIKNLVDEFNQNIKQRDRSLDNRRCLFQKILDNIEQMNGEQVKLFGVIYDLKHESLDSKKIIPNSFFNHICDLLFRIIQDDYERYSSTDNLIVGSLVKKLENLNFVGKTYFEDILFKIFNYEAEFLSRRHDSSKLGSFQDINLIRGYFFEWLRKEKKIALVEQLFIDANHKCHWMPFMYKLFPNCDEKLFDFLCFFYALSRNSFYVIALNEKIKKILDVQFTGFSPEPVAFLGENFAVQSQQHNQEIQKQSFRYIQQCFYSLHKFFYNYKDGQDVDDNEIKQIKEQNKNIKNEEERNKKIWLAYLNYKFQEITTILDSDEIKKYCQNDATKENNRKRFLEVFSHQF